MTTHVKVIAVLYLIAGALLLTAAIFTPMVLGLVAGLIGASGEEDAAVGATILGFAGVALSLVLAVLGAPFIAAGWGLLKFRPWARILGIILGAICLTKIPIGTLVGIYALVILFRKDTEALFTAPAGTAR
jgi:hypothetical protein